MAHIIRRKLAGKVEAGTDVAKVGPERQWQLAFARAARDLAALDVDVRGGRVDYLSLSELLDVPPARSFLCVLEGPQQALGFLCLSPELLSIIIEMQTTSRLSRVAGEARKPTRTDAAMVAGLIDAALLGFGHSLGDEVDVSWAKGFTYASFLEDVRPLGLILDDERFAVIQSEVSVPGSNRQGRLVVALPATPRETAAGISAQEPPGDQNGDASFQLALGDMVLASEASLNAVLTRIRLPLSQVMTLAEGDIFALPTARIECLSLETADGRVLASARLGQAGGMRAVRIIDDAAVPQSTAIVTAQMRPEEEIRFAGAA